MGDAKSTHGQKVEEPPVASLAALIVAKVLEREKCP